MSKCSLTNDSFGIIRDEIEELVLYDKSKEQILSFLKDFIHDTYEAESIKPDESYSKDKLTNYIVTVFVENGLKASPEEVYRAIYSDKIIENMEMARLEEIGKEIQIFQKYGAQIPACLLEEKEKLENRWRGKLAKEIENVLNARFRTMKTDISLIVSCSDEDGWRVVTDK